MPSQPERACVPNMASSSFAHQNVGDVCGDLLQVVGLEDEIIHASPKSTQSELPVVLGDDYGEGDAVAPLGNVESVHVLEGFLRAVSRGKQDEIRRPGDEGVGVSCGMVSNDHVVSLIEKAHSEKSAEFPVWFDNENQGAASRHSSAVTNGL